MNLGFCDESTALLRDQLLPVARRSLGANHRLTLSLSHNLSANLQFDPESTRGDLRLNQHR